MRKSAAKAADSKTWDGRTLRDPHAREDKAERVRAMFDEISPTYELVNRLVSLGRDATWRARTAAAAEVVSTDIVLDVCCGTGDMVRIFADHDPAPRMVLGIDFSGGMLARGRYSGGHTSIQLARADGLRLPLADRSIDVVSCAFGVRNFQDLSSGLREMYRVLGVGGRLVLLEFALPENRLFRWGYRLYCERMLPRLAGLISRERSGAYRYLPSSIRTFERRGAMVTRLRETGFVHVTATSMNFGGVQLYRGVKSSPLPGAV